MFLLRSHGFGTRLGLVTLDGRAIGSGDGVGGGGFFRRWKMRRLLSAIVCHIVASKILSYPVAGRLGDAMRSVNLPVKSQGLVSCSVGNEGV